MGHVSCSPENGSVTHAATFSRLIPLRVATIFPPIVQTNSFPSHVLISLARSRETKRYANSSDEEFSYREGNRALEGARNAQRNEPSF